MKIINSSLNCHVLWYTLYKALCGFIDLVKSQSSFKTGFNISPFQLILLDAVLKTIKTENLLSETMKAGDKLMVGLNSLQDKYPGYLNSVRGRGTFCAVNCDTGARRDWIIGKLREHGVHTGGCGESAIRLRPALVFKEHHADLFLEKLETILRSI